MTILPPGVSLSDALAASSAAIVVGEAMILCVVLTMRLREGRLARAADAAPQGPTREIVQRPTVPAHLWLLITIAVATATAVGDMVRHLGLNWLGHWFGPLADACLLLIGPSLWTYTKAVAVAPTESPPTWSRWRLHAAPAAVLFLYLALAAIDGAPEAPSEGGGRDGAEMLALAAIAIQIVAYLGAILHRVRGLRPQLEGSFSNIEHRDLRWLEGGAFTLALLVLTWIASWGLPLAVSDMLTNGVLAVDLALLGVFGARQLDVFAPGDRLANPLLSECIVGDAQGGPESLAPFTHLPPHEARPTDPKLAPVKYAKSTVTDEQAQAMVRELQRVMADDKPYLEYDLTLPGLAAHIGAKPHQLSQVLSVHLKVSFFEYVNGLRIEAVKSSLGRHQSAGRPLLDIALECGFGSKSAFNEAFKRATGMTPSAYRQARVGGAARVGEPGGARA